MWAGIAGAVVENNRKFEVAVSIHDSVYSTDFSSAQIDYDPRTPDKNAKNIELFVLEMLRKFSIEHLCKFLGAGVTLTLLREVGLGFIILIEAYLISWTQCPNICTRLWLDLDIVPFVFNIKQYHTDSVTRPNVKHRISSTTGSYVPSGAETPTMYVDSTHLTAVSGLQAGAIGRLPIQRTLDEQADSAARKCLMNFGPGNNPRLSIGPRNQVTVDDAGRIHLIDDIEEYRKTVGSRSTIFTSICHTRADIFSRTWNAVIKLADELREKKVKIGFFSSTPQGGEFQVL